jgi:hypothetical protein
VRTVDKRFTFWMTGYYDDFIGARTLPDDSNTPSTEWKSSSTHHGNPINGWATLNPRYTYAWCERGVVNTASTTLVANWTAFNPNGWYTPQSVYLRLTSAVGFGTTGNGVVNGDTFSWTGVDPVANWVNGISGLNLYHTAGDTVEITNRFNNAVVTGANMYNHNLGIHEWLTYDANRRQAGEYEGTAQLQFPDSHTNANRQKYDGGTGILGSAYTATDPVEGYMLFGYAHNSVSRYYAAIGNNDSTFGRAPSFSPNYNGGGPSPILEPTAGIPTGVTVPTTSVNTHLAGVYSGEVLYNDQLTNGTPKAFLHPIQSPSGKPFLVTEVYHTPAVYTPILSFDGSLNSKGDGDVFTIRIHCAAVDVAAARLKLRIGCEGTAMTSTVAGETGYSNAAISLVITPTAFLEAVTWNPPTLDSIWDDYDFVIDYTAYTYDLYKNGVVVLTGAAMANKLDASQFTPADMYGWEIDAIECDKKAAVLIDRVALMRPLTDHPDGSVMPIAESFANNSGINKTSNMTLTLIDDDAKLKLLAFFNKSSYADWDLLMFRDNTNRPIWRGSLTSLSYAQDANNRTPTIVLSATDYFGNLDHQIPNWELGESGDADSTSIVAYNRSEAQNNLNTYYFGVNALTTANATLGYNQVENNAFIPHTDSRMRNRSAHPIQMYDDEDTIGPNEPYTNWDTAITAGYATSDAASRVLHSRWMKDIKKSLWFQHQFGNIASATQSSTLLNAFSVGDTSIAVSETLNWGSEGVIEIVDNNGQVDSGVYTASGVPNYTLTNIKCNWYCRHRTSPTTGLKDFAWFRVIMIPTVDINWALMNNKIITITDTSSPSVTRMSYFNGQHKLQLTGYTNGLYTLALLKDAQTGSTDWLYRDPSTLAGQLPLITTGYTHLWNPFAATTNPTTSYRGCGNINSQTNTTMDYGGTSLTIPTTNFFQRNHIAGSTINLRNIANDYKHIWILWADMRNDGNANADSSYRRKEYGIMSPYANSYQLSLVYADQQDEEGNNQGFVDLALGEDVEMWNMDATVEPITGGAWSALAGGSNTETLSKYHDWEDKAGSFIILDASKFFNLNTYANGGRTGQLSGGRKEIGDYLVETEGFPVLIDNYWLKAPTGPYNLDNSAAWNANYKYFNNNFTQLKSSLNAGDEVIQFTTDVIKLPASGGVVGQIISREKDKVFHYYVDTAVADATGATFSNHTTGTYATAVGVIKVAATGAVPINSMWVGQTITIKDSGTSPNIDGIYEILDKYGADSLIQFSSAIAATVTSPAAIINAPYAFFIKALRDLGAPNIRTTTAGEWNNAGYGGVHSADSLMRNGTISNASSVDIDINPENTAGYKDALVYYTLANVFPMRLMMQLNGFFENEGSLTHSESDKIRVTWLDSLTSNWLVQTSLYGMPDLASTPITSNMTTNANSADSLGRGGYIANTTATAGLTVTVVTGDAGRTAAPHGLFDGDTITIIENSQLSGGSGDKYRTDYVISYLDPISFNITKSGAAATAADGFWRKAGSVDNFGSITDCRSSSLLGIFTAVQAGSGISSEYSVRSVFSWLMGRDSRPELRPTYGNGMVFNRDNLTISNLNTESAAQVSNVRLFYAGGASYVDYPSASLGARPRWEIIEVPSITNKIEALAVAKQEYEKAKLAPLALTASVINSGAGGYDGLGDAMLYNARYGYIADQSRTIPRTSTIAGAYTEDKAWAWNSMWGGNLFSGMQNALDGRDGGATYVAGAVTHETNYFWYGANSIANALQIVHIPQGMPKTTEKTAAVGRINADGNLRVVIAIDEGVDSNTSYENMRFRIYLLDYDWSNYSFDGTLTSHSMITIDSNGYYEIPIPSTYWTGTADERIVVSVNYDYLKSLARQRCGSGDINWNANDIDGITSFSSYNANSIFPLGCRKFADADYWDRRAEWYAPRLHITDDINFVPATTLKYTDASLELDNEDMSIRSINWSINGRDTESLSLGLERDISRAAKTFASYILPAAGRAGGTGGGTGGGGSGGSTLPPAGGGSGTAGGRNGGWPAGGAWSGSSSAAFKYAQANQLTSNTNPNRVGGNPDGNLPSNSSNYNIGSSSINQLMSNRIKGVMDFNNDSLLGGGFGVLGQKKPAAAPRNNDGIEGLDSFISVSSGDAIMGEQGMTFAGAVDGTPTHCAFTITAPIPPNVNSTSVRISSRATMGAATGSAVIYTTVEVVETGARYEQSTMVTSTDNSVVLFTGAIEGADVSGNTLKITIEREAGASPDTAQYGSVTLNSISVASDTRSVSGFSEAGSFTYSQ